MSPKINIRKFTNFSLIAAVINSVIYLIAKSADASMMVNQGGEREIGLAMVFGATFFGLVAAAYVVNLIGKKSQSFIGKSPLIGLIFGVVTAIAPFTASDDSKTALALASNHIIAGIVWFLGAKRSSK
ncbi:MAG: hypothetical protein EBU16_05245 [Actinobacteria bacterium]|nr:hypothetical protein [Actinomycetota bacterium]